RRADEGAGAAYPPGERGRREDTGHRRQDHAAVPAHRGRRARCARNGSAAGRRAARRRQREVRPRRMFEGLRNWRRERGRKRSSIDDATWRRVVARYPFTRSLPQADGARLRDLTVLFLHEKSIVGAGGHEVSDEMRMGIAAQAGMLVLNLGLEWYRGWVEV